MRDAHDEAEDLLHPVRLEAIEVTRRELRFVDDVEEPYGASIFAWSAIVYASGRFGTPTLVATAASPEATIRRPSW